MTIKNKDGSDYRLTQPNPLSQKQDFSEEEIVLHNFAWKRTVSDTNSEKTCFDKPKTKPEEKVFDTVTEFFSPQPTPLKTERKIDNVVVMHCLPIVLTTRKDELYGETYNTETFGDKFTFESVIVEREDLEMVFWTNIDLSKGSIVYPARYKDGVKFGDYRWWKVSQKEEKSNGFLVKSVLSDVHPDFSE